MSTITAILRRLDALEAKLAVKPDDNRSLEQVLKQLDLMAERMRADPKWREPTPDEIAQTKRDLAAAAAKYGPRQ
jgi:hypothetical protein